MANKRDIDFPVKFRGYDPESVEKMIRSMEKEIDVAVAKRASIEEEVKKLREENKILNHRIQIHEKANEEIAFERSK